MDSEPFNTPVRLELSFDVLVDDEMYHGLGDAEIGGRDSFVEPPNALADMRGQVRLGYCGV